MHIPFLLTPAGKDYIWGGTRLKNEFAKNLCFSSLAETWECSTHPEGPSKVASGPYNGQTLQNVLIQRPDFVGTHPQVVNGQLPILVKLIDAQQDLSIQVHPSDQYARVHENGQLGKTEMWYILHAEPGSKLVYGFARDMTKELVLKTLDDKTFPKYLQYIPVRTNDVFYIEPGTVHAIGKGIVLAEVQENSNITYRLYDYDRVDKNGQTRALHRQKALEVANLKASKEQLQPMRVLNYQPGCAKELIGRCKYFLVERILVNCPAKRPFSYQTGQNSFRVLLCTQGAGYLGWENGKLSFKKGDCLFVPASSILLDMVGNAQFLQVSC